MIQKYKDASQKAEELANELKSLQKDYQIQKATAGQLEEKMAIEKNESEKLLQEKILFLEKINSNLEKKIEDLNEKLKADTTSSTSTVRELEIKIEILTNDLASKEVELSDALQNITDVEEFKLDYKKKFDVLEKEVERLQADLKTKEIEHYTTQTELDEAKTQVNELNISIHDLNELKVQKQKLSDRLLLAEKHYAEDIIPQMESKMEQMEIALKSKEKQCNEATKFIEELEAENAKLNQEIASLNTSNTDITRELTNKCTMAEKQHNDKVEELMNKMWTLEEKNSIIPDLQAKNEELEGQYSKSLENIKCLKRDVNKMSELEERIEALTMSLNKKEEEYELAVNNASCAAKEKDEISESLMKTIKTLEAKVGSEQASHAEELDKLSKSMDSMRSINEELNERLSKKECYRPHFIIRKRKQRLD